MRLVRYNPNRAFARADKGLDSFVNSFFSNQTDDSDSCCHFAPRVDIAENENELMMFAEMPGFDKGEIKVVVEDNVLTISGERKSSVEDENSHYLRKELRKGSFSRAFTLPDYVEAEKINADYKDGVLKLTVPKVEKAKPKEISVNVN